MLCGLVSEDSHPVEGTSYLKTCVLYLDTGRCIQVRGDFWQVSFSHSPSLLCVDEAIPLKYGLIMAQLDCDAAIACSRENTAVASVRIPSAFSCRAAEAAAPENGSLMANRSRETPAASKAAANRWHCRIMASRSLT
jgi:hypothetical protein